MTFNTALLPSNISDFVAGKIAGKDAAQAKNVYSYQDPYHNGLGQFVRNTNCWLNGVSNISCFSPAQLSGANWRTRAGTLLTTKHVLFAKHFVPAIIEGGTPLIFVDDNNNVVRRNLVQLAYHPATDIAVGRLASDVPENIKIAKVLPKNYADYLDLNAVSPVYLVGLDQEEKALVKVFQGFSQYISATSTGDSVAYSTINIKNIDAGTPYAPFTETVIVGDSGNPVFFILNNELVVVTTWWTAQSGPFISRDVTYDFVNQMIESLSPNAGYALTDVDLVTAYRDMPKRYYSPVVDDSLNEVNNWFQNNAFTVPATSPPVSGQIPVLPWNKNLQRVIGGTGVLSGF